MQKYKYFISFFFTALPKVSMGVQNLQMELDEPITDLTQVQALEKQLATRFALSGNPVQALNIMGFYLLALVETTELSPVIN